MTKVIHPPARCRSCGTVFAADTIAFVDLEERRIVPDRTATCPACHKIGDVVPGLVTVDPSSMTVELIEVSEAGSRIWVRYADTVPSLSVVDRRG